MPAHARYTIDADVLPRFTACYLRIAGDECAFIEAQHRPRAAPAARGARGAGTHARGRAVGRRHARAPRSRRGRRARSSRACPNATLVAHPRAAKNLIDPVEARGGRDGRLRRRRASRSSTGRSRPSRPSASARSRTASRRARRREADRLAHAGHAYHHLVVDDPADRDRVHGRHVRPRLPGAAKVRAVRDALDEPDGLQRGRGEKSLDKVLSLGERFVCPTHYDAYEDAAGIAAQVGASSTAPGSGCERRRAARSRRAMRSASRPPGGRPSPKRRRVRGRRGSALALDVELNALGLAHVAEALRSRPRPPLRSP